MSKQPPTTSAPQATDAAAKQEQHATFRLDALGAAGTEALIEAPPKKRAPIQVIVLAALVIVAGGALFTMRKLGMGPLAASGEVTIDYDYDKNKAANADHQRLLADLTNSHVEQQVPVEKVQKNPFRMPFKHEKVVTQDTPSEDPQIAINAKLAKERQEKIQNALATLKVHSVLNGSVPVARIGEETVKVGDTLLEGLFTVTLIEGRSVEVEVDETTYRLSIDDEVGGKSGGKSKAPTPKSSTPKQGAKSPASKSK